MLAEANQIVVEAEPIPHHGVVVVQTTTGGLLSVPDHLFYGLFTELPEDATEGANDL